MLTISHDRKENSTEKYCGIIRSKKECLIFIYGKDICLKHILRYDMRYDEIWYDSVCHWDKDDSGKPDLIWPVTLVITW